MEPAAPHRYRLGRFELDTHSGALQRDGVTIQLQEQPLLVLLVLVEHAGAIVTREQLRRRVWPDQTFVDFDHGLNSIIRRLREALGDEAERPAFIETVPRRGYRLLVPAEPVSIAATTDPIGGESSATTRRQARFGLWAIALGLVLSIAAGVYSIRRLTHPPILGPVQPVRLAVLPFENLTGNQEQQFFADGLHEEMIFRLARVQPRQLSVIARTSVMRYRDAPKAIDAIGNELGVDFVLEGSVRRVDDRFRVTAQLIRAKDQLHLWTETYERSWNDIFAIQSDVSARVADSLAVELVPQSAALVAREAVSSKAHEHFLKGRFYWNQRARDPSSQLAHAIEQYKLAIAEQPNYAMAYAGLADAYNSIFFDNPGVGETAYSTAREALEHALQLDPRLAPAYSTLGWMRLHFSRNLAEAEHDFQRAKEIAPADPLTQFRHAHLVAARGRVPEAEREVEAARQSDPFSGSIAEFLGWLAYYRGDNATAMARMREAADLEGDPTRLHLFAAYTLAAAGDCANALTELQPWATNADTLRMAESVFARARCGDKSSTEGLQQALLTRRMTYSTAMFFFARGERDSFYEWLNRSIDDRFPEALYLAIDPVFAAERRDPRFEAAIHRVGL